MAFQKRTDMFRLILLVQTVERPALPRLFATTTTRSNCSETSGPLLVPVRFANVWSDVRRLAASASGFLKQFLQVGKLLERGLLYGKACSCETKG
jgi:hypothetical protein